MKKKEILNQIADWNERVIELQGKKAKLEREVLFIDVKLNELMASYDKLCKKLLKNISSIIFNSSLKI